MTTVQIIAGLKKLAENADNSYLIWTPNEDKLIKQAITNLELLNRIWQTERAAIRETLRRNKASK